MDSHIFPQKVFISYYKFGQLLRCFDLPLSHLDGAGILTTVTKFGPLAVFSHKVPSANNIQ